MQEMQRELREAKRRRFEDDQRRREDQERVRCLKEELDQWRLARDVREYVIEIRSVMDASKAQGAYVEEVLQRLNWMEVIASHADPIAQIQERLVRPSDGQSEVQIPDSATAVAAAGEKPSTPERAPER
jgi:hypothetical protein